MPAPNIHKPRTYYNSEMSTRASSTSPGTSRKVPKSSASSSAPSSRPPVRSDPFYGHEETAVLCSKFITSLFACPNIPTAVAPGAPTPALAHFVAYALHRTRLPSIVTFAALLLLQRLKTRFPAARGSSGHRLFISAFMIASKIICDDTYSNQSWGIVAQKMFALKEINQMEREMCGYLEWNLNVAGPELESFEKKVRVEHGPRHVVNVYPTSSEHRLIRPVPTFRRSTVVVPSAAPSPADYHLSPPSFASANSSLASSPASDDCKTPSPIAVTRPAPVSRSSKMDFAARHAQAHYPMTSAW